MTTKKTAPKLQQANENVMHQLPLLFLLAITSPLLMFCHAQSAADYDLDTTSPNGTYRVKIHGRAAKASASNGQTVSVQIFKGTEAIYQYEWDDSDRFESTFRESKPILEWVSGSVLRVGEDRSDQPFLDDLSITNMTSETLKYLSISYGRNEIFWVFDLAPGQSILLKASPRFKADGTSNHFLGYGGLAESGKKFDGVMEKQPRKTSAEGSLRFHIAITTSHLK